MWRISKKLLNFNSFLIFYYSLPWLQTVSSIGCLNSEYKVFYWVISSLIFIHFGIVFMMKRADFIWPRDRWLFLGGGVGSENKTASVFKPEILFRCSLASLHGFDHDCPRCWLLKHCLMCLIHILLHQGSCGQRNSISFCLFSVGPRGSLRLWDIVLNFAFSFDALDLKHFRCLRTTATQPQLKIFLRYTQAGPNTNRELQYDMNIRVDASFWTTYYTPYWVILLSFFFTFECFQFSTF